MLGRHVDTLVIGAGPAGLAAAHELASAGHELAVVERADGVGGLARTYVFREDGLEFRTDTGPHRFFSKNPYLYELIGGLLDERWLTVRRRTRQYIDGQFFDYPINAAQVLRNLGPGMVARVLVDYATAAVRYRVLRRPIENFRDFAFASFGKTLAEFNIINYTEKVWGVATDQLHRDWAGQRIHGLDLLSVLRKVVADAVGRREVTAKSLVDEFYYPELGTGLIYDTIRDRLVARGIPVVLETRPTRIRHAGTRILDATLTGPGGTFDVAFEHLIESVHLPDFLELLDPPPPAEVLAAARALRYRSQVYLFVTLDKPRVTTDQWIYFPRPDVPFERWSEMKNFSARMSPPDKTSLFIEFFCFADDPKWQMTADQLLDLVLPVATQGGFFTRAEVRRCYRLRGGRDYPIYDLAYRDHLRIIKTWLDRFENLAYIGRPGRFRYTNQDHSLEMGILAARGVLTGERVSIEAVGTEAASFERGTGRRVSAGTTART
jgi:protoporphyrinogen oxidase